MRVGFDIGGTFTDVIVRADDGSIFTSKVLSILDRVGEDVANAVRSVAHRDKIENFVHGTTVASNALIEGTTARTALITTRGFRDELEMRGQRRPNIYDVNWDRLPALIPRSLRLEVNERILGDASVEQPLDLEHARATIEQLLAQKIEAIAVCLINSYLNPMHERQLATLLAEMAPRTLICLSADIHPEIKEYDRASTTAVNASLIPVVDRYLNRLEQTLSPLSNRLLVMQSNGGIMSAQAARRRPVYMIESGPAAGALAAARLAAECGLDQVLSFDMGGTTVKACLIENGKPLEKPGGEVGAGVNTGSRLFGGGGHVVRVPAIDIVEAGAGGGSIAWLDDSGALRVGPRSAGAEPGPVCYGHGGSEPTVTDANVVLGYMNPNAIAGSTLTIDRDAAAEAIQRQLAVPLRLNLLDVAYGITQVANSAMTRVLRAVTTERGRDPRGFTLLAFGGAGPIHAAALAENMGISRLIVPLHPGLFSALGLLLADYRHDYIAAIASPLTSVSTDEILGRYQQLKDRARSEMIAEGVDPAAIRFEQQVDLKYGYQMYEMTLPFPEVDSSNLTATLTRLFTDAHNQAYGYYRDDPIEIMNVRLRALASAASLTFADLAGRYAAGGGQPAAATSAVVRTEESSSEGERAAFFGPAHGLLTTPLRSRFALTNATRGPIIVEEPDTTVVVPPNWTVQCDSFGNLVMNRAMNLTI